MEYSSTNRIYIPTEYSYDGLYNSDLVVVQSEENVKKGIVTLCNAYDEVMFESSDLAEIAKFIIDLKAGKYDNGKEE